MTFACDKWDKVKDNINAIANTIAAIRGIERWGASDMMERAFSAFEALPPPMSGLRPWYDLLGARPDASANEIEAAYRLCAFRFRRKIHGSFVSDIGY